MKIKNAQDLDNADSRYNLTKIPSSEIEITSVDNFWDGPLSGECLWREKSYYYECFDQVDSATDSDIWPRKYLLLSLTDKQSGENRRLQRLFERSADSESLRREYIKILEQSPKQEIKQEQIIAWFDSNNLKDGRYHNDNPQKK